MGKWKDKNWWMTIMCAALLVSCATESAPTGGKEDTEPPKVKVSNPPNKSTFFTGKKIEIQFNEFIQPVGFAQTLVSPPVAIKPDIRANGRKLTVLFKSELLPNTTYTINFGDDIKDLNQGNVMSNFSYVFSTGAVLDSQKIEGNVRLAKDDMPAEGIVVALFQAENAFPILTEKPRYFAKTNKQGAFQIENIKPGKYEVFGLKDQNMNYLYDQPNEQIAYLDSLVELNDSITPSIALQLFSEDNPKVKFGSARSLEPGKMLIAYSAPFKTLKADSRLFENGNFSWNYATNDTTIIWFSNTYTPKDSVFLTCNDTLKDTVRLSLKTIEKDSLWRLNKYSLNIENQSIIRQKTTDIIKIYHPQELYAALKINLSRPIVEIDKNKKLQISVDSTDLPAIVPTFEFDTITRQKLMINFERKENTRYLLQIPDSIFKDVFGLWNKSLSYPFRTRMKSEYGNIKLNFDIAQPNKYYIIQLFNTSKELVQEFYHHNTSKQTIDAPNMAAGDYTIRVIDDVNRDGEWTTGSLRERRQPERTINFSNTYNLKGNWDLAIDVKID